MIIVILIASFLGILLGFFTPMIPYVYTKYTAIAIMSALDSIFGAINASLQHKFDMNVFVSGFFTNMFIAISFTVLGESLDVDITLAAIVVFIFRIFNNLSGIRREILNNFSKKKISK
ncbi:MAG: small basic family protein [Clostridia bacterium]|nr:small basic family protein [Clostridia bacterium]